MSEEDVAIFRRAIRESLETQPDGAPYRWHNPDTGVSGVLMPLRTETNSGTRCRTLRGVNKVAGTVSAPATYRFCRQTDGIWRVQPDNR